MSTQPFTYTYFNPGHGSQNHQQHRYNTPVPLEENRYFLYPRKHKKVILLEGKILIIKMLLIKENKRDSEISI